MKILLFILMPCLIFASNKLNEANLLYQDGNYNDALKIYEPELLEGTLQDPVAVLDKTYDCLEKLNLRDQIDSLLSKTSVAYPNHFSLLWSIANRYRKMPQFAFYRKAFFPQNSNQGEINRIKSLQLFFYAHTIMPPSANKIAFYTDFAKSVSFLRNQPQNCYLLQNLSDISQLPNDDFAVIQTSGAPVDENNQPIFYSLPDSLSSAKNDGEIYRWLLNQISYHGDIIYAKFLNQIFSTCNIRLNSNYSNFVPQLRHLTDQQTITLLASGITRFTFHDEHNPIIILKKLPNNANALELLANLYLEREQFSSALNYYRQAIKLNPDKSLLQNQIDAIANNWCELQPIPNQIENLTSNFNFLYRNATNVKFVAKRINQKKLFEKVKEFYKNNNREQLNYFYDLGKLFLENSWATETLSDVVAQWELALSPGVDHLDQEITVSTPLQQSGLYLLSASVPNGNTSTMILNVKNTQIIRKNSKEGLFFLICDPISGKPLPKIKVEIFGHRDKEFVQFAQFANENGIVTFSKDFKLPNNGFIAVADEQRFDIQSLNYYHYRNDYIDKKIKNVVITDRPIYQPNQEVHFQAWCGYNDYALSGENSFSRDNKFQITIKNSRYEDVFSESFTSNNFGSFHGKFLLPNYAPLGTYYIFIGKNSVANFRVEEYKKPEYEVTINSDKKSVILGDSFDVKVNAIYYFGQPVTNADVTIKVMRYQNTQLWYPITRWDWLFGYGFCYNGNNFIAPANRYSPPEEIINTTANLDKNGQYTFSINTALAKKLYSDTNHRYEITAEVRDLSRRTIFAKSSILAAKAPFEIFTSLNQGFYQIGNKIEANIKAYTIDNQGVNGDASLALYQISYLADGTLVENLLKQWDKNCDNKGEIVHNFTVETAGRYRLKSSVTYQNFTQQNFVTFDVHGKGFNSNGYHYNALEIIPEKTTYLPNDIVRLKIATARPNSTVFLFPRAENGFVSLPQIIHLPSKTTIVEIPLNAADQP
ncbi:MAG: MG2 domain-containing protein, partial [Lentisphaeria bacterium]